MDPAVVADAEPYSIVPFWKIFNAVDTYLRGLTVKPVASIVKGSN
jgi:hypothetical protein